MYKLVRKILLHLCHHIGANHGLRIQALIGTITPLIYLAYVTELHSYINIPSGLW